ncbi:MAG TPA: hypothetical protein VGK71_00320 [Nitrospirota bacterium]
MERSQEIDMYRLVSVIFVAGLLFTPATSFAASAYTGQSQDVANAPPVEQPLVREGDFAIRLVEVLDIGKAGSDQQAEAILTKAGIYPSNGWIADYPVTPVVLKEVKDSVREAALSGTIHKDAGEAGKAFAALTAELGLDIRNASASAPEGESAAPQPSEVINNYYYEEGPPVVTYYAPPPDYYYLYDWVPSPFWWADFWFPGFFVLGDFDLAVIVDEHSGRARHHRHDDWAGRTWAGRTAAAAGTSKVISNTVADPKTKRFSRVDPVSLSPAAVARTPRNWTERASTGARPGRPLAASSSTAATARSSAQSILRNSAQRSVSIGPRSTEGVASMPRVRRDAPSARQSVAVSGERSRTSSAPTARSSSGPRISSAPETRSFSAPSGGNRSFAAPPAPSRAAGRSDGGFGGGFGGRGCVGRRC